MRARVVLVALAAGGLFAGCSAGPAPPVDEERGTVTVLAAASLTEALDAAVARFEAGHPDVDVVVSYGGSSALAEQIVSGSPADVFFAADESAMATVATAGLSVDARVLLANTLEIAVPPGNPGGVTGLEDFADPGLTIALCDPAVPCGAAAARLFALTGIAPRPDTLEQDVKATLAKVQLGEVDAALVYSTDVLAAGGAVEGILVPEAADRAATNRYPLTVLTTAPNPDAARAFVEFLRSSDGIAVFSHAGFAIP